MNNAAEISRHQSKTAEQRFLQTLQNEFHYAPKIAESILAEAQDCFRGNSAAVRTGQMRVLLVKQKARSGQTLPDAPKVEVTWTVDSGREDLQVLEQSGMTGLRQVRLQRLLDEALEQGALATQEDLARALQTSVRTIKRDFAELHEQGLYLPSRGYLLGIGRGQTHKAQIVRRWLHGETYDQLSQNTHHCVGSIQRYIRVFVQVVRLQQEGLTPIQIGLLLQIGETLVQDYLDVYEHNAGAGVPRAFERANDPIVRRNREKGGEMTHARKYAGTHERTFQQAVVYLLETQYGVLGAQRVLDLLARDIQELATQFYPNPEHLEPGWMVFTGVRAAGAKAYPGQRASDHPLVTMAWPVLLSEDLQTLAKQGDRKKAWNELSRKRLIRIIEHGLNQPEGAVLLTLTDLACMLNIPMGHICVLLKQARQETGKSLMTKGYFFDQGMRPTHKNEIIDLYESGLDEAVIARETNHAQDSVGQYIRDYERVKLMLKHPIPVVQIHKMINMQPSVVKAYVDLATKYHPELLPEQVTPAPAKR